MEEAPKQTSFRITDRRGQVKDEETKIDVKAEPKAPPPPPPPSAKPEERYEEEPEGEIPQIDFSTFVVSMSTSALVHMGLMKDPHSKKIDKNLPLARQEVDILTMLDEKTRGNLNPEEKRLMDGALYELRVRFVEASK